MKKTNNFTFIKGVKNLQQGCKCVECTHEIQPSEPFSIIESKFYCKDCHTKHLPK